MYKYWGFGLHISSEIEFTELLQQEFTGLPDLQIKLGTTPGKLTGDNVVQNVRVSISPKEYLLRIFHIANYYAADGNLIIVEPMHQADWKSIRLFLLGSVISAILHQRAMIPVHASAIERGEGIVLFSGPSGAGKSTIAAMLQKKGYSIFSDDICVLKRSDGVRGPIEAFTSYPMIKLWHDSFEKIGIEMAVEENKIRPNLPKFGLFYPDDFKTGAKIVKQVFILDKSSHTETPEIEKLGTFDAFRALEKNAYRRVQINSMKLRDVHFAMLSELVGLAPVYKITRPVSGNTLETVIRLILEVLPQNE